MHWLDAPVSGGTLGAEEGTLAIMAGGTEADFNVAAPVVAHTAGRFTLMGPVGSGQLAKLCNQMISGSAIVAVVMSLPTSGPMLVHALQSQDQYLAGSFLLFLSFLTVIGMFVSDLLLAVLDPRIRLGAEAGR